MDTRELGNLGEKLACEYLVKKGYKILGKNYRIRFGEIDIIAKKKLALGNFFNQLLLTNQPPPYGASEVPAGPARELVNGKTIHFVEVKTLESKNPQSIFPEEHVDYKKQRKLKQMSQIWLAKKNFPQNYPYQIDIIGILVNQETKKAKIHYFENVVKEK